MIQSCCFHRYRRNQGIKRKQGSLFYKDDLKIGFSDHQPCALVLIYCLRKNIYCCHYRNKAQLANHSQIICLIMMT